MAKSKKSIMKKNGRAPNAKQPPAKKQKLSAEESGFGQAELRSFEHRVKQSKTQVSSSKHSFDLSNVPSWQSIIEKQYDDTREKAKEFMNWLLFPVISVEDFEKSIFERKVMYISRHENLPNYYASLFTSEKHIPELLDSGLLEYTYDVDVTLYKQGTRYTLNPSIPSVVDQAMVMDFFNNQKCSIRFLRPHQHVDPLCSMLTLMEEHFQMGSGCNAYWTPSKSQGFSPHYDDVDVFILQLEGTKIWSLYQARDYSEVLPTSSSPNFSQEEVEDYLVQKIELHPGDLLYCPRGTIHQANTESQNPQDSLHLTFSTSQNMSWKQYLQYALPRALEEASSSSNEAALAFNRVLPLKYGSYMGLIHEPKEKVSTESLERDMFRSHLKQLLKLVAVHLPVDDSTDEMFARFLHDRLPPQMSLTSQEREQFQLSEEALPDEVQVSPSSKIRFISASVARLVVDSEEQCSLIHSARNTRIYHELEQPERIEFAIEYAPALEYLLKDYPKFSLVSDLPELEDEEKIELAQVLHAQGVVFCVNDEKSHDVKKSKKTRR